MAATDSLDAQEFVRHRLTEPERRQFSRDGFILLPNALPPDLVARLQVALQDMLDEKRAVKDGNVDPDHPPYHEDEDIRQGIFCAANNLQENPDVLSLLTYPTVLPKITDLMGTNIYCYHGFCPCTHGSPADTPLPDSAAVEQFDFHRDGGLDRHRGLEFDCRPSPRLTAKAIYYISDCSSMGCGNTW